ncbi:23S rRNA (adenine(1618)-N(6))-methyltransferase RlmF [Pedobacter frigoris]|uniref:Ribosomal RNA large subunit methyltransferase F n=1 Tax=Pedobacter frigoris TaxID=2571272 RepID=A0A4U1CIX1_9SPHI|nr:23S rRNA (adenine(1618)-N(6))-methyltransferase RlmF [Pedobacter frigoris]TKC07377.1 23S rRNA (adenine(1618)-N(6))-methyltransferase RlmF [Pedobacter frigoris]
MYEKTALHPRNKHRSRYDFPELMKMLPQLRDFLKVNAYGDQSVDFSDPAAVKTLNKALLKYFYEISNWDIPDGYLCPPIPGRADYIHYIADLLAQSNAGIVPKGKSIKGLDIGMGANCVYPIIGHQEYGWSFLGSEVDMGAVKAIKAILSANPQLTNAVTCRHQTNPGHIFNGIVKSGEIYDFTLCNPPFHASAEEARAGTQRKLQNLGKQKGKTVTLNFGGQNKELWYEGGEVGFIRNMIEESNRIKDQCFWFTTLVSKSSNLPFIFNALKRVDPYEVKQIEMAQGQKISRFVAWTFLSTEKQREWAAKRWNVEK